MFGFDRIPGQAILPVPMFPKKEREVFRWESIFSSGWDR